MRLQKGPPVSSSNKSLIFYVFLVNVRLGHRAIQKRNFNDAMQALTLLKQLADNSSSWAVGKSAEIHARQLNNKITEVFLGGNPPTEPAASCQLEKAVA